MQFSTLICVFFQWFLLSLLTAAGESPPVTWNENETVSVNQLPILSDTQDSATAPNAGEEYKLKQADMLKAPSTQAAHELLDNSFYLTPVKRTPEEFSPVYYGHKNTDLNGAMQQHQLISELADKLIEVKALVKCVRQELERAMASHAAAVQSPLLLESSPPTTENSSS